MNNKKQILLLLPGMWVVLTLLFVIPVGHNHALVTRFQDLGRTLILSDVLMTPVGFVTCIVGIVLACRRWKSNEYQPLYLAASILFLALFALAIYAIIGWCITFRHGLAK